jgi:hypothetical protein
MFISNPLRCSTEAFLFVSSLTKGQHRATFLLVPAILPAYVVQIIFYVDSTRFLCGKTF